MSLSRKRGCLVRRSSGGQSSTVVSGRGCAKKVADSTDLMVERWGDVLDRLGSVTGVENLTLDDLLGLVHGLGIGPVRDLGLLEAAIARPQSSAFREDAYPTIKLKAVALLDSHEPRVGDGNKRVGWLATTVFLDVNGEPVGLHDDNAFQLVLDVAEGRIGAEEIADRLMTG